VRFQVDHPHSSASAATACLLLAGLREHAQAGRVAGGLESELRPIGRPAATGVPSEAQSRCGRATSRTTRPS